MTEITLRFYTDEEQNEEFFSIESPCQPFSVGDKVWCDVKNGIPAKWDIENKRGYFLIEKIEFGISKTYNVSVIEHLDVMFIGKIVE